MFSKPLSALLVLVGIAVASVQHSIEDSDLFSGNFAENQVQLPQPEVLPEVAKAWVDIPFDKGSLQSTFEPVGDLSALGSDEWTTLRHPVFPKYSVRIKQSRFCDTTVK
jgi:hypothetical protein